MIFRVIVDKGTCEGSGACIEECPANVYAMGSDEKVDVVNESACVGCEACITVCPTASIVIRRGQ
jgi:NAD-dependent dihydropyrimidine dehydrogenase PreA subunit